jgi:hypothetical protein
LSWAVIVAPALAAQPVTVEWDPNPEPDIAGYVVLVGRASGATDDRIDVGTRTSWTSSSLQPGTTYFFRVLAYNTAGTFSLPSREVSTTVAVPAPPPPDPLAPPPSDPYDTWSQRHGVPGSGTDDPDGDGLDNRTEYLQGTDPLSSNTLYLAEGSTGSFEERIALANAADTAAFVTLQFLRDDGTVVNFAQDVPAASRATVIVNDVPGLADAAVSAVVRTLTGQVAVERTMAWHGAAARSGAHTAKAADGLATEWYLAEGSTSGFDTWVLVANPNPAAATLTIDFLEARGAVVTRTYTVPAASRLTLYANAVPGVTATSFSTRIRSSTPVAVERAMYFGQGNTLWRGGHAAGAVRAASRAWFVAEGRTGPFFDTWLLIANPGDAPTSVRLRYLTPAGLARDERRQLPAHSRTTIFVNSLPELPDTDVSVVLEADAPIVVERSMYWPDETGTWQEAHASAGLTALSARWILAEGEVGGPNAVESYVLLANPAATDVTVSLRLLREGGRPPIEQQFTVKAASRRTVALSQFGLESGERCGALVEATGPIAVERSMYWNAGGRFWSAGTNETGTALR